MINNLLKTVFVLGIIASRFAVLPTNCITMAECNLVLISSKHFNQRIWKRKIVSSTSREQSGLQSMKFCKYEGMRFWMYEVEGMEIENIFAVKLQYFDRKVVLWENTDIWILSYKLGGLFGFTSRFRILIWSFSSCLLPKSWEDSWIWRSNSYQ